LKPPFGAILSTTTLPAFMPRSRHSSCYSARAAFLAQRTKNDKTDARLIAVRRGQLQLTAQQDTA